MDLILSKLEYNQIIQIIEKYCNTYIGKKLCENLYPYFEFSKVEHNLLETSEATTILYQKGQPPFFEIDENLEHFFKVLESGQSLSAKGLLSVAHFLELSALLYNYFYAEPVPSENSVLEPYFSSLYKNPSIQKNILDKIIDEVNVADDASSNLFSLRKNKKNLEAQIKDKLNSYIHSSTYSKYIMDPIITIRNNRYVIPVKEEYRDKIKGFIHDTSASGSTLYIEPTSIFDLNNKINHIEIEEELEIEKILQELSSLLFPYVKELKQNLEYIALIDLIFAKATYGKENNGIFPHLNNEKYFSFYQARHPLIAKDKVVPIDIGIGKDYECLLITGPNTGGKTVALKTMGLLLLMAYSGIPIPCKENTNICVFSKIFVDIGDEQSIEQSLSTFSAHILNIVNITNEINENSLVLLDELGSGTDPVEGSALAISILNYLKEKGALICSTTHFPELKEFALVTDGFENASFEFDLENLKPTYHLLMGIPGKSNAFEISKKLGLNSNILENASSFLEKDKVSFEELLKNIYDDKLLIEKEKIETEKNLNQITILRQNLEAEQTKLNETKKDLVDNAKMEARSILLEAKEDAQDMIKELQNMQEDMKDGTLQFLKNLSNSDFNINENVEKLLNNVNLKKANEIRNKINDKIKNLKSDEDLLENSNAKGYEVLTEKDLKEGLIVWIPSLETSGTILNPHVNKASEVFVQVGLAKMNLKLSNLSKMPESNYRENKNSLNDTKQNNKFYAQNNNKQSNNVKSNKQSHSKNNNSYESGSVHTIASSKSQFVSSEINVIGQNVDDAIYVIDKYIDNCSLAQLSPIRIVHGKGTGKLREGIHNYLKKNPHVKSFRLGTFGEGEMGVTVVELK